MQNINRTALYRLHRLSVKEVAVRSTTTERIFTARNWEGLSTVSLHIMKHNFKSNESLPEITLEARLLSLRSDILYRESLLSAGK